MRLILVGGGGHCLAVIDAIESAGEHQIVGVVAGPGVGATEVHGYPVIGNDGDLPHLRQLADGAIVTVGQIGISLKRVELCGLLKQLGYPLGTAIAPSSVVSKRADIAEGSVVLSNAVVGAGVTVGANAIINSQAVIEHEASIGMHCHVATAAIINGGATVGDGCFIGSGAVIREGIRIGDDVVVGAGNIIGHDLPSQARIPAPWGGQR